MLYTPQHLNLSRFVHRPRPRLAIKMDGFRLLKAANVFSSGIHREGGVYLKGGVYLLSGERVISMRPEHEGQLYPEVNPPSYYRANVFSAATGECRFVDLPPAAVLKVVSS